MSVYEGSSNWYLPDSINSGLSRRRKSTTGTTSPSKMNRLRDFPVTNPEPHSPLLVLVPTDHPVPPTAPVSPWPYTWRQGSDTGGRHDQRDSFGMTEIQLRHHKYWISERLLSSPDLRKEHPSDTLFLVFPDYYCILVPENSVGKWRKGRGEGVDPCQITWSEVSYPNIHWVVLSYPREVLSLDSNWRERSRKTDSH